MMPDLFWGVELAWKSSALAALSLMLLRAVRERSAAQRSFLAHAGLLAVAALPLATLWLPTWSPLPATKYPEVPWALTTPPEVQVTDAAVPSLAEHRAAWLVPWLYLAPAALLMAGLLAAVARLWTMRHRASVLDDPAWLGAMARAQRRMAFKHGTAMLVSDELRSPISWGVLRPTIVLDRDAVAAADEAEAIIAHELAHVARWDWAKLLLARLVCALFWFNPLVWMLARESHQLREEAADDAVLLADVAGASYATLLVNAARHDNPAGLLVAHGVAPGRGSLKRRVARVLDARLSRTPVGAGLASLGLMLVIAVVAPLAALGPGVAAPAEAVPVAPALPAPKGAGHEAAIARAAPAPRASVTPTLTPTRTPNSPAVPGRSDAGSAVLNLARQGPHGAVGPVSLDDIVAARALGIDPVCVEEFAEIFPGVRLRDVVAARAVGVTTDYARSIRRRFPAAGLRDVIRLRAVDRSEDRVGQFAAPARIEARAGDNVVHIEAGIDGRATTRVSRGGRTLVSISSADPPEPD